MGSPTLSSAGVDTSILDTGGVKHGDNHTTEQHHAISGY